MYCVLVERVVYRKFEVPFSVTLQQFNKFTFNMKSRGGRERFEIVMFSCYEPLFSNATILSSSQQLILKLQCSKVEGKRQLGVTLKCDIIASKAIYCEIHTSKSRTPRSIFTDLMDCANRLRYKMANQWLAWFVLFWNVL